MKKEDFETKVLVATEWSAITNLLRKFITPITNIVLARLLTPEAFGIVATINVVISFADIFTDAGFQKYLVQHEFVNDRELFENADVAFWTNLMLSIVVWITIAVFQNSIAQTVGSPGYGIHLTVAAISIPLTSFSSIQQAVFRRNFDFKGMFVPRVVNAVIPLIITIPLAFFLKNCWALIIGTCLSNLSDAILLTVKSKWRPRIYYNIACFKEMFSFAFWTLLESVSIWLTLNVDIFILGRTISDYYLGLYKVSATTVNQLSSLITTTIIPVLFSALSRNQTNKKAFDETFYSFQRNCAVLLIPMSVGIWLYSDVITWILLGEQWQEASGFIGLIGLSQALTILVANFASEVYRAKGEPKISLMMQSLFILLIVPFTIMGSKLKFEVLCKIRFGLLMAFVLMNTVMLIYRYKMSLRKMFFNMSSPVAASMIMLLIGIILRYWSADMKIRLLTVCPCVIGYFFMCFCFKDSRKVISDGLKKIFKSV